MLPSISKRAFAGARPLNCPHTGISLQIHIFHRSPIPTHSRHNSTTVPSSTKPKQPLRILFCGSDNFSTASLSALHDLHLSSPDLIESIDVLVRPGKPSGRGLKRVAVGPLFQLAESLGLPIHQRDTFTGWDLPLPGRVTHLKTGAVTIFPDPLRRWSHRGYSTFNIVIAVSFGLFVPPRILNSLEYGGLNVHPSLLPDLRGPAPLQWTILAGRRTTGATLQTLHPTEYDRGHVLAQTPAPGLPVPDGCATPELLELLAPEGARLLVDGLRRGVHVPPYAPPSPAPAPEPLLDAPKIAKLDACVDWGGGAWARHASLYPGGAWTADDLARRFRAVGTAPSGKVTGLWTHGLTERDPREQRVIFQDVEAVPCPDALREAVLAVVERKHAALYPDELDEAELRMDLPEGLVNVVFSKNGIEPREYRVPVMVDKDELSVIVPVRVPYQVAGGIVAAVVEEGHHAIRVRMVKIEGETTSPAPKALDRFMEKNLTLEDIAGLNYAVDVIAKRVE